MSETGGGTPLYKPISVWNRVWFYKELRECMNIFVRFELQMN